MLVLVYHGFYLFGGVLAHGKPFESASQWVLASNPLIAVIAEGHAGVGLFIVLSGFVLSMGTVGRPIAYGRFILARLIRIYPALLVVLVAALAVRPTPLDGLLGSLPPLNTAGSVQTSFTAMFWAVAIEFQCYLVFPFLMLFADRQGGRFLLRIVALALMLRFLAVLAEGAGPRDLAYWTVLGRIDQFCIGMIAARLHARGWMRDGRGRLAFAAAAGATVLALWAYNRAGGWPVDRAWKLLWPDVEACLWAAVILTYLRAGRELPPAVARWATLAGVASYSIYLVHFVVLHAMLRQGWLLRPTGIGHYDALLTTVLVAVPVAAAAGAVLHLAVERPFLGLRPHYVGQPVPGPPGGSEAEAELAPPTGTHREHQPISHEGSTVPMDGTQEQALAIVKGRNWFYQFVLPDGSVTATDVPASILPIHTSRRDKMLEIIRTRIPDAAALTAADLASHEGWYTLELAKHFRVVTGYELRKSSRDAAELITGVLGVANVSYVEADLQRLEFDPAQMVDFVLLYGLIYHVEDPIFTIRLASRLARKHILIETQVFPYDIKGVLEDGSYDNIRPIEGVFGLTPDYPEGREGGSAAFALVPSLNALLYLLRSFGFTETVVLPAPPGDYEQFRRGQRVLVYGRKGA